MHVNAQPPSVRVLVADDLAGYREPVMSAVAARPELELLDASSTGGNALDEIRRHEPDVTLLDVGTPGVDVVGVLEREELPTLVAIVSARIDGETVYTAVEAGVKAYLSDQSTPEQICDAVVGVAGGETVLGPELSLVLAQEIQSRAAKARQLLSSRELEVLELIAQGYDPYEVQRRLYLSETTLRAYVHGFCHKLEVTEVADAVNEGMRRGIIR